MSLLASDRPPLRGSRLCIAVLLVVIAIELAVVLWMNEGRLVFTLDDAYIHFAVAENLLNGQFGVNAIEPSAPSSSILWPFLWAPFSGLPHFEYWPFLVNVGAAMVTVYLYHRVVMLSISPPADSSRWRLGALITCLMIPATNLVGLVFTGMEHSLQVMLAVMAVTGLIFESRTGEAKWWALIGLAAGPLIRYENLAICVPGLLYLYSRGHRRKVISVGALVTIGVVGYSLFLRSLDLGWIPTSVSVKSNFMGNSGPVSAAVQGALQGIARRGGLLFSLMMIAFFAIYAARNTPTSGAADKSTEVPAEKILAGAMGLSVMLHLMLGKFGWYGRYEVYSLAPSLLAGLYLFRKPIRRAVARSKPAASALLATALSLLISLSYWTILLSNATASNNNYEQQYQMHRFVTDYYRAPVAVNDLGHVSFGNPNYVLDLWGLASAEALHLRRSEPNTEWMNMLAERHEVKLALIYASWFGPLPANWQMLATIQLSGRQVTAAGGLVSIYALKPEVIPDTVEKLAAFKVTLPVGVKMTFVPPYGNGR